ncbi:MAG: UDP-N-acetylmuramoyl-L-alanyl-D-glutamate--2,6-diaminopimelate ligase [Gordonia sp.]|uniref:UDP-N-acetylmuramoyl-L-alanyl-D-glutamate--2, 6-diaminopimelate ligase n=1 Tax=Williamsia sp. 1138 TaxID=1903117 RepID=UPI000A10A48B|nr:UDP-N-acetylmuramoyl-L-alanyl-D-glutamate--2,6-diaminopimelate ligase [Williamsia sp. 1138]MBA4022457.1 UDP-N-acetylmuramoyl-L-alanyl-D-glutamate--2,6-diaminopimelate ligase [Gordonia sp. (in: high G+C Gram-positive bacteria)]OZG28337.1 UDP-N-acetylmuramoyl-L-alanyl-D-glutamate--2,6-diaminopimelate ligase [Williamsia sp. 1138]
MSAPDNSVLRPAVVTPTEVAVLSAASGARIDLIGEVTEKTEVTGVSLRAQHVRTGDLFAALPGSKVHGAQFAADALAAGATAVLTDRAGRDIVEAIAGPIDCAVLVHPRPRQVLGELSSRIYGQPSRRMALVGITGTSGKTTTSYLTEAALMAAGHSVGLIGTVETRIAGIRQPSALTTPEAPELQGLLAAMLEQGVDAVVMEVSSHALELGRVDGSVFGIGAFTNLSQDHLDFHPTMRDYFNAKSLLFHPDSTVHALRTVICVDDEWGREMARIAGENAVTLSTGDTAAHWHAGPSDVAVDGSQTVTLTDPAGDTFTMTVPMPGRFNVANALTAVAIASVAGVATAVAIDSISEVAVPGRVERVSRGQDFLAVVDYAHKPAALEAVIETLRGQTSGRIAVVVGAGGNRDTGKRPLMGEAAARGAELVVITDDNPRTETPSEIRAQVLSGAHAVAASERPDGAEAVREIGDRAEAIRSAVAWAQPGDVVLIAGKGHEAGQEIHGVKHPFDDRIVLAEAIEEILTERSVPSTDGPARSRRHD